MKFVSKLTNNKRRLKILRIISKRDRLLAEVSNQCTFPLFRPYSARPSDKKSGQADGLISIG